MKISTFPSFLMAGQQKFVSLIEREFLIGFRRLSQIISNMSEQLQDWPQSVLSIFSAVVLDEAEATRGPFELVQAHDDPLDVADFAEQLVQLLLRRVEGHVAHVQRRRLTKQLLLKWFGSQLAVAQ